MKAVYCVGTHWDREWYEPFQEFRMWLVELIDELMDVMEDDPEYKCFHLDGQTVMLEDYLEIRPERRERLVNLLKQGRLIAGPWYDLPDEWLISGESYIRNIMKGLRICRELGVEPMRFAYTPDQFGHIAALPMIMTGLGLQAGICWRGTQDENYPAQFMWVGPDGSRMVTHKLCDYGSYGPFDMLVRNPVKKAGFSDESFKEHFEPYIKTEQGRSPIPLVLMLDAIDHQRPDPEMPRLLDELRERYPDIDFSWESLATFGEEMLRNADKLPERHGELREPSRAEDRNCQYLIVHTISSRYPLKQQNDQCQALMEKWAEPYVLLQQLAGGQPILSYLDKAWQYLLRNHPHDSICGCSVDQVHRDMFYRFDQCRLIADGVVQRAMAAITPASDDPEAFTNVVVHNPLPFARKEIVDIPLVFRTDWPKRFADGLSTAEHVNKFILVDKQGERIPFQMKSIQRGVEHKVLRDIGRKSTRGVDVYHIAVELELPPCGYTGFTVQETTEGTRNFGSLRTGPLAASTGLIDFTLNPDGTARLIARGCACQGSGASYDGLFTYEDCGDSGDGWTRGRLIDDIEFRTPGTRVTTAVDEDGPLRTVFRVEREIDLPAEMDRRTFHRSAQRVPLRITDLISIEKGAPFIRVRTHVENTCKDHRLRVLFPTHVQSDVSFAETPFAIVERGIPIPPETATWQERINPEKAFTTFFGLQDETGGLAILAPFGLHEYEVTQTPERSLALTLFRSTFKTVGTPGEPDGELLGGLEFEYLLYPFADQFDAAQALRLVAAAQAQPRAHCAPALPEPTSLLSVEGGDAIVTALKTPADGEGGIIRLWNPGATPALSRLRLSRKAQTASLCDLKEEPKEPIILEEDGTIPIQIPPKALATVRFTWQQDEN